MKTLINRDFTRLWYGQGVSKVGDYVFTTTLFLRIATKLGAAIPVIFLAALPIAMVNTAIEPLIIEVTPRPLLGRVVSVLTPVTSVTQLGSTMLVGWLMSSVMLHFHADVAGLHMGPVDTIFTFTGLLFVLAAGYAFVMLPRGGVAPQPHPEGEAEPEPEPSIA